MSSPAASAGTSACQSVDGVSAPEPTLYVPPVGVPGAVAVLRYWRIKKRP